MSTDDPFMALTEEDRQELEEFVHVGYLTKEIDFCGHSFGLKTLSVKEELAAAKAVEPFRNTIKEPEAWATAQVGMALTHVDGDPDFCNQQAPDKNAFARARFNWIGEWQWTSISFLYQEFAKLLAEQQAKIRQLQDFSHGSLPTSLPSVDSLIEQGIFNDETDSAT